MNPAEIALNTLSTPWFEESERPLFRSLSREHALQIMAKRDALSTGDGSALSTSALQAKGWGAALIHSDGHDDDDEELQVIFSRLAQHSAGMQYALPCRCDEALFLKPKSISLIRH